jgi:hypothetical protein
MQSVAHSQECVSECSGQGLVGLGFGKERSGGMWHGQAGHGMERQGVVWLLRGRLFMTMPFKFEWREASAAMYAMAVERRRRHETAMRTALLNNWGRHATR